MYERMCDGEYLLQNELAWGNVLGGVRLVGGEQNSGQANKGNDGGGSYSAVNSWL